MNEIAVNKELIQSYILTSAKYDYSVYEKRILYRIIELLQEYTKELLGEYFECKEAGREYNVIRKNIYQKYSLQKNLFGDIDITMPLSAFLKDKQDHNHAIAKQALLSLNLKRVQCENENVWELFNVIERPTIDKKRGYVSFRLHPVIASVLVDFSKGYSKYALEIAMKFESVYSMRFFELLNSQTKASNLTYTIEQLKSMFQIQNRYKQVNDFLRFVIEPAKKELDAKSPYSFDYHVNKQGRKFHSITFFPIIKEEVTEQQLRKYSPKKLSSEVENYLLNNIGYTQSEIEANRDLWFRATMMLPDILVQLEKLSGKSRISKNPKGWIIGAIKKMIEKIREERHQANQTIFGDN